MIYELPISKMTSKIETIDSHIPCANCIIKYICSRVCQSFTDFVSNWPYETFQKYSRWYNKTLSRYRKEVYDGL